MEQGSDSANQAAVPRYRLHAWHGALESFTRCSHAIPAMQEEAAALIAGLVFAA